MEKAFVNWTMQPGREVMPGDVVWDVTGVGLQVIRAEIAPGVEFPIHRHQQEQIIVVVEGALQFTVGATERIVRRGEVIHIPPEVPHGGFVHGDDAVVTIEAFHPVRQDFGHGAPPMDLRRPK